MPQFLEPPPTYIKEFNWHWAQWFNKLYESLSFRGGLIYTSNLGSDISSLTSTPGSYTPVNFEQAVFDTYNMYDALGGEGSDDVVRIPEGVQRIRYTYSPLIQATFNGDINVESAVLVNATQTSSLWTASSSDHRPGQGFSNVKRFRTTTNTTVNIPCPVQSGVVNVQEEDVLSFGARHDIISGTVSNIEVTKDTGGSFFAWEIIE